MTFMSRERVESSKSSCVSEAKPITQEEVIGAWTKLGHSLATTTSWECSVPKSTNSKAGNLRASFDTPEARHNFCLSAFRPDSHIEEDSEPETDGSSTSSVGIEDEQHALSISPKLRFTPDYSLRRTDQPVTDFAAFQPVSSKNAVASKAPSADWNSFQDTPSTSSLKVEELWANVSRRNPSNPFEGLPNDTEFFGHNLK